MNTAQPRCAPLFFLAMGLLAGPAPAAHTVATVNTIEDVVDFGGARQVADLPGPDGLVSFREALEAVNNTPGPQTVAFNIPPGNWGNGGNRMAQLRQEDGMFVLRDDGTFVDFSTQTAFSGDTNPDGEEVAIFGLEPNAWGVASIFITGNDCTIKGLDSVQLRGYGVRIEGNNNRVIGSTITGPLYAGVYINGPLGGDAARNNVVGGTGPGEGNFLSSGNDGVRIDGPAADNVVVGNVMTGSFHGVSIRGGARGNRIGGPTVEERNVIAGAGNYGEEGFPDGDQISITDSVDNIVQGNFIGTTADGLAPESQVGPVGVRIWNSSGTVIVDNLISGLVVLGVNHFAGQRFGAGIRVEGDSPGTLIQGNLIGTDVTGDSPVRNHEGVVLDSFPFGSFPANTIVGGVSAADGNVIAFSELTGVRVGVEVTNAAIVGNSIFDNGGLGIALWGSGNNGEPAPAITAAITDGTRTGVRGTLTSRPDRRYRVEFFANAACDPSGFGEGERFLGFANVQTDAAGAGSFTAVLGTPVPAGEVISATSTDIQARSTSQFSACREVVAGSR